MVQFLLINIIYGRLIWLDQNVFLTFSLASQSDRVFVSFQNLGIRPNYYRSTVLCHVLVVVQHTVVL